jgi:bla regulator protein blaR1
MSLQWLALLLDVSVKGILVLALAGMALSLGRRCAAAVRHLVWSLALLGLAAMPLLTLALPQLSVPILPAWGQSPAATAPAVGASAVAGTAAESVRWPAWVLAAWAAGVAVMMLGPVLGIMSVRRYCRGAVPISDRRTRGLLAVVLAQMGIRRPVVLLESRQSVVPLTYGLSRSVIILPRQARTWSDPRLRAVLLHEAAHIRRADCLTQLLATLVRALYWFNPLVWLAVRAMRVERERACDDMVLGTGIRPSDYARYLLDIVRTLQPVRIVSLAAVGMARSTSMEGRIRAILCGPRPATVPKRSAWVAAIILVAAPVISLSTLRATTVRRETPGGLQSAPAAALPGTQAPAKDANSAQADEIAKVRAALEASARKTGQVGLNLKDAQGRVLWRPATVTPAAPAESASPAPPSKP